MVSDIPTRVYSFGSTFLYVLLSVEVVVFLPEYFPPQLVAGNSNERTDLDRALCSTCVWISCEKICRSLQTLGNLKILLGVCEVVLLFIMLTVTTC